MRCLPLLLAFGVVSISSAAVMQKGDIVIYPDVGGGGYIYRFNAVTGEREAITDITVAYPDALFNVIDVSQVIATPQGGIFYGSTDGQRHLGQIDPTTGVRSLTSGVPDSNTPSNNDRGSGPEVPYGPITGHSDGFIYSANPSLTQLGKIDPMTGDRQVVSLSVPSWSPKVIKSFGNYLYVLDYTGELHKVDPTNGTVSSLLPAGSPIFDFAIGSENVVYGVELVSGTNSGSIHQWDLTTQSSTTLFEYATDEPDILNYGLATLFTQNYSGSLIEVDLYGRVIFVARGYSDDNLIMLDPATRRTTILAGVEVLHITEEGPYDTITRNGGSFGEIIGIAVYVPETSSWVYVSLAGIMIASIALARKLRTTA